MAVVVEFFLKKTIAQSKNSFIFTISNNVLIHKKIELNHKTKAEIGRCRLHSRLEDRMPKSRHKKEKQKRQIAKAIIKQLR